MEQLARLLAAGVKNRSIVGVQPLISLGFVPNVQSVEFVAKSSSAKREVNTRLLAASVNN